VIAEVGTDTIGAAHCTTMNASDAHRREGVPNSRGRGIKGQRRRFRWRPLKREWRCTKERSGGDYSKRTYSFHDSYSFTTSPSAVSKIEMLSRRIFDVSQGCHSDERPLTKATENYTRDKRNVLAKFPVSLCDHNEQALAYVYFEDEPGRRSAAKLLSKDLKKIHQFFHCLGIAFVNEHQHKHDEADDGPD
jgi:hypothetical protein